MGVEPKAHDSGVFNPKKPGNPKWPEYNPSRDELLSVMAQGKMWGVVCGSVSGNLRIVDYDLYKIIDGKDNALEWRRFLHKLRPITNSQRNHILAPTLDSAYPIPSRQPMDFIL